MTSFIRILVNIKLWYVSQKVPSKLFFFGSYCKVLIKLLTLCSKAYTLTVLDSLGLILTVSPVLL